MKTKFHNCPPGTDGKLARSNLRAYGRGYLLAWSDRLAQTKFDSLTFFLIYVLPDEDNRGFLSMSFNDNEGIRFYVSPGELSGSYIADKIEYRYTKDGQTVSFEVTRDEGFQNLFTWLEWKGTVGDELRNAQLNAN